MLRCQWYFNEVNECRNKFWFLINKLPQGKIKVIWNLASCVIQKCNGYAAVKVEKKESRKTIAWVYRHCLWSGSKFWWHCRLLIYIPPVSSLLSTVFERKKRNWNSSRISMLFLLKGSFYQKIFWKTSPMLFPNTWSCI